MAMTKWIGGVLGWIVSGGSILGALAGYCIGALIGDALDGSSDNGSQQRYGSSSQGHSASDTDEGERNSFLFSMLVLASYIIRADGKVMHSEMTVVRQFLRHNFGVVAEQQGEEILLRLFEEQKRQGMGMFRETIRKACIEIRFHMNYSMRLQLLDFLAMIAKADGSVPNVEVEALKEVATVMGLSKEDVESLLAMDYSSHHQNGYSYGNSGYGSHGGSASSDAYQLQQAYKVLGISASATDDEVKKAYRQMALKHHPDRVATLGDDVKKAAERKFQEINQAKDIIYKARGL